MDAAAIAVRITRLDGEIDGLSGEIRRKEDRREKVSDGTQEAIGLDSLIKALTDDRSARSATRDALLLRLPAVPVLGKNPPLAVDASVPPLYANTQRPPLVVASLSSETPLFKPRFKSRFKPCVDLEAACSYGACPPVVRGVLCCTLVWRVRSVRYAVYAPLVVRLYD